MDANRILIVDDNSSIHADFRKILTVHSDNLAISSLEKTLFDDENEHDIASINYEFMYVIDDAFNGEDAIKMVESSQREDNHFTLIFMDVVMPGGIDGIETIAKIWKIDPYIEIVICTAYSEYSWNDIINKLGATDRLLLLKKPFDSIEVKQIALALVKKWKLAKSARFHEEELNNKVKEQTFIISSMFDFANTLNSLGDLDDILDGIIDIVQRFITCSRISIMLVDESNKYLTIKKSIGIPRQIEKNTIVRSGEGISGQVFEKGEMLLVNNIEGEGFTKRYSNYDAFLCSPFICAPLVGYNVKLGVLNITNKSGNKPFTHEDANIISYISYTAAIAINNKLNEVKIENNFIGMIKSLAEAIEAKDPYTRGHSDRVSKLAVGIAIEMELSRKDMRNLKFSGILHDIGKIGVPESVLSKPAMLSPEEFDLVKKHPVIGENILKNITFLDEARDIIRHHHERIDGSGYPDGLRGNDICLGARIIAVADIFDSMNTDRPYRRQVPLEAIKNELIEQKNNKIDAVCVDALLRYLNGLEK